MTPMGALTMERFAAVPPPPGRRSGCGDSGARPLLWAGHPWWLLLSFLLSLRISLPRRLCGRAPWWAPPPTSRTRTRASRGVGAAGVVADTDAAERGRGRRQLLERSEELARIESALAEARSGRGTVVVIEGPAGIGKTALARGGADGSGKRRNARASVAGADLERDFAFGVVRQLFEPPLAEASELERADLLQAAAGVAAGLLGLPGAPRGGRALVGRRFLVRGPARPLLVVREPGRRRPALPGGRRRALGGPRVPALPGLPAHASRRAGRRAHGRDPPPGCGHRCRAARHGDDRCLR